MVHLTCSILLTIHFEASHPFDPSQQEIKMLAFRFLGTNDLYINHLRQFIWIFTLSGIYFGTSKPLNHMNLLFLSIYLIWFNLWNGMNQQFMSHLHYIIVVCFPYCTWRLTGILNISKTKSVKKVRPVWQFDRLIGSFQLKLLQNEHLVVTFCWLSTWDIQVVHQLSIYILMLFLAWYIMDSFFVWMFHFHSATDFNSNKLLAIWCWTVSLLDWAWHVKCSHALES